MPLLRPPPPTILLYLIMLSDDFDLVNSNFLVVFFKLLEITPQFRKYLLYNYMYLKIVKTGKYVLLTTALWVVKLSSVLS